MNLSSELSKRIYGYAELMQIYNKAMNDMHSKIEIIASEYQAEHNHCKLHHVEHRLKTKDSIVKKLTKRNLDISLCSIRDNITDVAGVRAICNYVDDIYELAQKLTSQDGVNTLRKTDYIKNPKPNGYRSLHLIVEIPIAYAEVEEYVPVEIQIRTISMDLWACLEHKLKYKSDGEVPSELYRRLKICADSYAELDNEMQSMQNLLKN